MLQTNETIQTIPLTPESKRLAKIRGLNDTFRRNPFVGGRLTWTAGVAAKDPVERLAIFQLVRSFDTFNDDNDPWREHDFGAFDFRGERIFWKIDYYTPDLKHAGPDPADSAVTHRVLTIMLASEY
jgi:hypothetical protein